jgi:hypothetical protein
MKPLEARRTRAQIKRIGPATDDHVRFSEKAISLGARTDAV